MRNNAAKGVSLILTREIQEASHLKPAECELSHKIIYLPRESRRTTSPEYPANVQRRTFDAGRAEQALGAV